MLHLGAPGLGTPWCGSSGVRGINLYTTTTVIVAAKLTQLIQISVDL